MVRTEESYNGLVARLFHRRLQKTLDTTLQSELRHLKAEAERREAQRRRRRVSRPRLPAADGRATPAGGRRGSSAARELRLRSLMVGWTLAAAGLLAAAVVLPGLRVDGVARRIRRRGSRRHPQRSHRPCHRSDPLPFTVLSGFLLVLVLDAAVLWTRRRTWSATPSRSTRSVGPSRAPSPRRLRRSCSRSPSGSTTTTRTRCV